MAREHERTHDVFEYNHYHVEESLIVQLTGIFYVAESSIVRHGEEGADSDLYQFRHPVYRNRTVIGFLLCR